MNLANSSRTSRIRDGRQAVILGETLGSPLHIEKDGLKLADILQVSEDFLQGLKKDLDAHEGVAQSTSPFPMAGYVGGDKEQPVGMSKKAPLALNRAGQALQFLAAYYVKAPTESKKYEIAQTAARIYNIFVPQAVFSKYELIKQDEVNSRAKAGVDLYNDVGYVWADPSAALMLIGMIAVERQGVIDHAGWTSKARQSPAYTRDYILVRLHGKIRQAILNAFGNKFSGLPSVLVNANQNDVFYGQKLAKESLNGTYMAAAAVNLYRAMYGKFNFGDTIFEDTKKAFRRTIYDFGTLYDNNGNVVDPYTQSKHGMNLSLAVGHHRAARGAFPSVGYNSLVAFAFVIQAMAETATANKSTFLMLNSSPVLNHELRYDAMTIQNYYRYRIQRDKRMYELGAHNNMGYDASRAAEARAEFTFNNYNRHLDVWGRDRGFGYTKLWRELTEAQRQQYREIEGYVHVESKEGNSTFYELSRQDSGTAFKGQGGYAYSFAWVLPTHSLLTVHMPEHYGPNAYPKKATWEIDYTKPNAHKSLMHAFAGTHESVYGRVLSGLAANLFTHQTTVQ